ncbi:MAG: phosrestin [Rubrivivax sp.]|nr:phosrestin [Pyrinomonadaceae bacterium]
MKTARIDFDTLPWTQPADGLRFKSTERDGRRLRLLEFAPSFGESEWCQKSHAGYVVAGELEIEFADRAERFAAGDALLIEGDPHRAKAGSEGAQLFLVEDA